MDQFTLANALMAAHGGDFEVVRVTAGGLIATGESPESLFMRIGSEALDSIMRSAQKAHVARARDAYASE